MKTLVSTIPTTMPTVTMAWRTTTYRALRRRRTGIPSTRCLTTVYAIESGRKEKGHDGPGPHPEGKVDEVHLACDGVARHDQEGQDGTWIPRQHDARAPPGLRSAAKRIPPQGDQAEPITDHRVHAADEDDPDLGSGAPDLEVEDKTVFQDSIEWRSRDRRRTGAEGRAKRI